jgi:hypothetical protein
MIVGKFIDAVACLLFYGLKLNFYNSIKTRGLCEFEEKCK